MKKPEPGKFGKTPERIEADASENGHGVAVDTLDAPKFLVPLLVRDSVKRFRVPITVRPQPD